MVSSCPGMAPGMDRVDPTEGDRWLGSGDAALLCVAELAILGGCESRGVNLPRLSRLRVGWDISVSVDYKLG